MKRNLTMVLALFLTAIFATIALAGNPKCPCFKAKDLEKLAKKGYRYSYYQTDNETTIYFTLSKETGPDKGRRDHVDFGWYDASLYDDVEDACEADTTQYRWKGPNYLDSKYKGKTRPLPTGSDDSAECAKILDDFLSSTTGAIGAISLEDTIE